LQDSVNELPTGTPAQKSFKKEHGEQSMARTGGQAGKKKKIKKRLQGAQAPR